LRIAITHPYSWPEVRRGAERIVVETSRALAARGHRVTLLTAGSRTGSWESEGVSTIKVRRRFASPLLHERHFAVRIAPFLLQGRFDVVHSMMAPDAYMAILLRRWGGYRVLFDEMGIPYGWYWRTHPDRRIRRRIVREVDVYACMSQYALDVLKKDWGRVGELLPGGVRLSEFTPSSERELSPTILFSGALTEPRKGVPVLIESLALVAQVEPDVQLWLSGPGDVSALLATAPPSVQARVHVLPMGTPQDQAVRYGRAWITVLPSVSDSFGLVLVESLASGTPIVVVNDAAPPSLVTPLTGAVATRQEAGPLADALCQGLRLARDPATTEHCRQFALQFDWDESIAPMLEGLYRRS
jgi:phosphatidylinositol alpha-mannosyltransferase